MAFDFYKLQSSPKVESFKNVSFFGFFTCLITFILAFLFKDYLINLLMYLETKSNTNIFEFHLILFLLFVFVSLPVLWGYIICVFTCSYVYAFYTGFLLVFVYSSMGMTISFFICRYMFYDYANTTVQRFAYLKAFCAVIQNQDKGYKIVFLSRLMPLPFGLVNALFAVADINYFKYILASVVGLIPGNLILCYIGSTLKSMSDVLVNQKTAKTATFVFVVQIIIAFGVMYYILNAAKLEMHLHLNKDNNSDKTTSDLASMKIENVNLLNQSEQQETV